MPLISNKACELSDFRDPELRGWMREIFARLVRQEHVSHGYTDYWDEAPITWKSLLHVLAYPTETCGTGICHFPNSYDSAWYSPHSGERTFIITNTAKPQMQAPAVARAARGVLSRRRLLHIPRVQT
jgi:hypothetical protein